ncbi:MAG: hypothetical protein GY828_04065 [Candidatus Gracilibacteria bacterium]|nr:hypothetical protein [Candidatus Gracilibacteria bacterium]
MIKKILLACFILSTFFFGQLAFSSASGCTISTGATIEKNIKGCISGTNLVQQANDSDNLNVDGGFKDVINGWTKNIALFLGILSVGSVVFGGLMMTLSAGEDEKITKAKDIVKWGLIGLLAVVLATTVVTLVINVMYGFSG